MNVFVCNRLCISEAGSRWAVFHLSFIMLQPNLFPSRAQSEHHFVFGLGILVLRCTYMEVIKTQSQPTTSFLLRTARSNHDGCYRWLTSGISTVSFHHLLRFIYVYVFSQLKCCYLARRLGWRISYPIVYNIYKSATFIFKKYYTIVVHR